MDSDMGRVLIVLLVATLVAIWTTRYMRKPAPLVCLQCGTVGPPKNFRPGSGWIEVALFFAALGWVGYRAIEWVTLPPIVGAVYSLQAWVLLLPVAYGIYRAGGQRKICRACGAATLVPPETPAGRRVVEEQQRPAARRAQ